MLFDFSADISCDLSTKIDNLPGSKYMVYLVEKRSTDELIVEILRIMRIAPLSAVIAALVIPSQRNKLETYFTKFFEEGGFAALTDSPANSSEELQPASFSLESSKNEKTAAQAGGPSEVKSPRNSNHHPTLKYIMKPLTKSKMTLFLRNLETRELTRTRSLSDTRDEREVTGGKVHVLVVEDNLINQKVRVL